MSYTKTTWVANQSPAISATNLNKIEEGVQNAHEAVGAEGTLYSRIEFTADTSDDVKLGLGETSTAQTTLQYRITLPPDWKEGTEFIPFFTFNPNVDIIKFAANPLVDIGDDPIVEIGISAGVKVNHATQNLSFVMLTSSRINEMVEGQTLDNNKLYSSSKLLTTYYAYVSAESSAYGFAANDLVQIRFLKPTLNPNPLFANGGIYDTLELNILSYGIIYEVDGNGSTSKYSKTKTW